MHYTRNGTTLIDVSHVVSDGMMTYKGLPTPIICDYLTREASTAKFAADTSFQIGVITLCSNTGTYVDVPFHRFANGKDLADFPLDSLANLDAIKIRIERNVAAITPAHLGNSPLAGKAVLFETNWSRHWGSDTYFENHPFITQDTAARLRDEGAVLVGIDSYNIDDTRDKSRPAHTILLGADIPIVEHMTNVSALPERHFRFFAVPVKIEGMGTFPVRAFGIIEPTEAD